MIATDDDGGGELAARDHLVEGQSEAVALSQADPANARRKSLELKPRARQVEPMMQVRIVGDQLLDLRVGLIDIFGIAGQGGPAERAYPTAEQRADVLRHETWEIEGMADAGVERYLPDVVAIVENRQSHGLEAQQILDVF